MNHPSSTIESAETGSFLKQPRAVWAVAFACVIAFMGIGLVDPILKEIAAKLDATPSQVSLLFTSYMAIMGVAMLVTGVVSSRIGPKRTLLSGLVLIIVFAALAGSSNSVGAIIGFRAGWGLGNALFVATALSTIVSASKGSVAQAIILFEAALGLGIASGPLIGGLLGEQSWRGPFFGVSVLMTVALVATAFFLPKTPPQGRRTSLADPFRALRHPALLLIALVAICYNLGFFTLLAAGPFALPSFDIMQIGWTFFGWGVLLALTSVVVAPRLQRAFGTLPTLLAMLVLFGLDLVAMAVFTEQRGRRRDGDHRRRRLPRRDQHPGHRGGHGCRSGRAAGRVRGVLLRPLHRRRHRARTSRSSWPSTSACTRRSGSARPRSASAWSSWPPAPPPSGVPSPALRPRTPRPRPRRSWSATWPDVSGSCA